MREVSRATRVVSVDLLRGLVMIIMALDHTREYFTNLTFPPELLARTSGPLFFTRYITHFCAPVFFLLAGTGAFLSVANGKTAQQISQFFWTRGLWLVVVELTVVDFGWTFIEPFGAASVIWALGWCMVAMALIVRLPVRWIAVLGVGIIALHGLLDRIDPASFGRASGLWMVLHTPGFYFIKPPDVGVLVLYPLVPWIGVMAAGYALGALVVRADRRKLLLITGAALTLAFFALRAFNHYGNGVAGQPSGVPLGAGAWTVQPTLTLTVIAFLDTLKYPPSLDYLLMTLGPALMGLAWFDGLNADGRIARVLLVYGRVPLFYYVLHIYLLHLMAIAVAALCHQPAAWLWQGAIFAAQRPEGYGHGLPFIYLMWFVAVGVLYLPCRWFMKFKQRHRDWGWLSYV
jgi:uncharacterized membrane protein